jgi:hypothetical protein
MGCRNVTKDFLMKKFSKKGVLLFGVVLMVCAFVVPSMASAASWGVIGSTHVLDSSDLSFLGHTTSGTLGEVCADSQFHVDVRSAAILTITSASFKNCMGIGTLGTNCTVTRTSTRFPWSATGASTTNVQIHDVHIDVKYENTPGNASTCALSGALFTWTGTLNSGSWNAATHSVTFTNATGLVATSASLPGVANVTVSGTIRDTAQTLTLT